MAEILITDLTESSVEGSGVFDKMMQATKAHLAEEYKAGRIKGPEYSTVYLGAMQSAMNQALQFVLTKQRSDLEAQLMAAQVQTEASQRNLVENQTLNVIAERDRIVADTNLSAQQLINLAAEKLGIDAQTSLTGQQETNLAAEKLLTDSRVSLTTQQITNLASEKIKIDTDVTRITQEITNLAADKLLTDAQAAQTTQQTVNLAAEKLLTDAKASLTNQQVLNAVTEETVLVAQECKLRAEFDQLEQQVIKTTSETSLLNQKRVTEAAQTTGTGVDADSVIGRQKSLYEAQTAGFARDAEQKTAKLMADTWNVRRTTDDATQANDTNKLDDAAVGRAITKMLDGVNA